MVGEIRSVFVKDQRMIRKGDSLSPALEIKSKVKDANKKKRYNSHEHYQR